MAIRVCDRDNSRLQPNGRWEHGSWDDIPTLHKNIALICDRGTKLNQINNIFVSDKIFDFHLVGSGSYGFPLYIKKPLQINKLKAQKS